MHRSLSSRNPAAEHGQPPGDQACFHEGTHNETPPESPPRDWEAADNSGVHHVHCGHLATGIYSEGGCAGLQDETLAPGRVCNRTEFWSVGKYRKTG